MKNASFSLSIPSPEYAKPFIALPKRGPFAEPWARLLWRRGFSSGWTALHEHYHEERLRPIYEARIAAARLQIDVYLSQLEHLHRMA